MENPKSVGRDGVTIYWAIENDQAVSRARADKRALGGSFRLGIFAKQGDKEPVATCTVRLDKDTKQTAFTTYTGPYTTPAKIYPKLTAADAKSLGLPAEPHVQVI